MKIPSTPRPHRVPTEALDELWSAPAVVANNSIVSISSFGVRIIFIEQLNSETAQHIRCALMLTHESALGMAKAIVETLEGGNYGNGSSGAN